VKTTLNKVVAVCSKTEFLGFLEFLYLS